MAVTVTRPVVFPSEIDRILRKPGGPVGVTIRRMSLDIAKEAATIARSELGNRHPSDAPRTGQYAKAFRVEVETTGNSFAFVVRNNKRYAHVLEEGSKPHEIRARKAKYLRFISRKTGQWVRVKVVQHPGQREGYHILWRATEKVVRASLTNVR